MTRPLRLTTEFSSYMTSVGFPAQLSQDQRIELRRAFMGGAAAFKKIMENAPTSPREQHQFCVDLEKEMADFVKDVLDGRA